MLKTTGKIGEKEIFNILGRARDYALCMKFDECLEAMSPLWSVLTGKPQISGFSPPVQAEILLRCGALLSWHSGLRQATEYNTIARDWMTEALVIFEDISNREKIAETQIELAYSYWREGAFSEAEAWMETAADMIVSPFNQIGIKLIVCHLLVYHELGKHRIAQEIIKANDVAVGLSDDSRMKVHYYINSGLIMHETGNLIKALDRYKKTVYYSKEVGNDVILGVAYNNTANIYAELKMYDKALENINYSIALFKEMSDLGRQASCYDSKAMIYLKSGDTAKALKYAEMSIKILEKGEEYATLVGSLLTKSKILISRSQPVEALLCFTVLAEIARSRISEAVAEEYTRDFAKLIYFKKDLPMKEEILHFERHLISEGFQKSGGLLTQAATALGVTHQTLSEMLKRRHEELRKQLNIKIKAPRARKKFKSEYQKKKTSSEADPFSAIPQNAAPVKLVEMTTDRLAYLGLEAGTFAVCAKVLKNHNNPLIVKDFVKEEIHGGFLDEYAGIIGLSAEGSELLTIPTENCEIIGMIVGYCKFNPQLSIYEYHNLEIPGK
jgi:tetratricopeptide (TPR) repeat protein